MQARRGELIDALAQHGLVAERSGEPVGLLMYRVDGDECEVVVLIVLERRVGVGTALLDALRRSLAACERIWLVTTNDNVDALRHYQRRGFRLRAVRIGAVDAARRELKPEIPVNGDGGIPIRDELELELPLRGR
jgi:ribosomal protein S18 acetylase RimI-like enzyme